MWNEGEILEPSALDPGVLQFTTVEPARIACAEPCQICSKIILADYYYVNNQTACAKCAGEAREGQPSDSRAAFARGLFFGTAAAILGVMLYSSFTVFTNIHIGFMALAIALIVPTAILKGSNGIGGTRYQIAAVLLTYFAISVSAVPVKVVDAFEHRFQKVATQKVVVDAGDRGVTENPGDLPNIETRLQRAAVRLAVLGIASPFLGIDDPLRGLLGLVILIVALRVAYQLAGERPFEVDGPYTLSSTSEKQPGPVCKGQRSVASALHQAQEADPARGLL
jgi:hypothetical protein